MKLVAVPVVVRKHPNFGAQIHTQIRHVINKGYDPLYDGTEETCGETVDDFGDIRSAMVRGLQEELGRPDIKCKSVIGEGGKIFSTTRFTDRPEDLVLIIDQPYCFVQQLKGPQPWAGLGFIVVVSSDIEFKPDKEGEVAGHRWWGPEDLLKALKEEPGKFMGFHYPVLLKVCEDIISGKLKI